MNDLESSVYTLTSELIFGFAIKNIRTNTTTISCILVVDSINEVDLNDSQVKEQISAIIVRRGSLADHPSVILNGWGMQLAIAPNLPDLEDGQAIFIDGERQRLVIGASAKPTFQSMSEQLSNSDRIDDPLSIEGESVSVLADANNLEELRRGIQVGADGIGLLRTEWIDFFKEDIPNQEVYSAHFAEALKISAYHQLNIRLLDIGGDKIPNWSSGIRNKIVSPLGKRGIRALEVIPEVFKAQITAFSELLPANISAVIPMVTDVRDIENIRFFSSELLGSGLSDDIKWAAVIETPAAALEVKEILDQVEFLQFGPGDLTQFTLARLRAEIEPIDLSGGTMHSSVLKLAETVVDAARNVGKQVIFCLDREPRRELLKQLLALGARDFSVSPSNVIRVKARLAEIIEN